MPRFHTVIPIHNVDLDPRGEWDFAGGFVLAALPAWVRRQPMLENLSSSDREALECATHGFVVTYEAEGLGAIQKTKEEQGILANLALWLSRPCPVHFITVLHAPQFNGEPTVQQTVRCSRLLCHPKDENERITAGELTLAAMLHGSLLAITQDTAIWTAVRATWAGLQMNIETIRYSLFWIGLEALFGPENARGITKKLSQRIAAFLRKDPNEAVQLLTTAKNGYRFRSKIVHGLWNEDRNSEKYMAEAETIVRRSLVRILKDPDLTKKFSETRRESFLNDLVSKNVSTA